MRIARTVRYAAKPRDVDSSAQPPSSSVKRGESESLLFLISHHQIHRFPSHARKLLNYFLFIHMMTAVFITPISLFFAVNSYHHSYCHFLESIISYHHSHCFLESIPTITLTVPFYSQFLPSLLLSLFRVNNFLPSLLLFFLRQFLPSLILSLFIVNSYHHSYDHFLQSFLPSLLLSLFTVNSYHHSYCHFLLSILTIFSTVIFYSQFLPSLLLHHTCI